MAKNRPLAAFDPYDPLSVNHYEALDVSPESDAGEIRRAYLALARRYHPDFHADADEATRSANAQRMQALNEAWEVLGDPAQRAAYDRSIAVSSDPGVARRAARERQMPEGKGWTPRPGDDGWMSDYQAWANESDEPYAPDEQRSAARSSLTILPVGLLVAAVLCMFLGLVLSARPLVAVGVVCVVVAGGLFGILPMLEMSRGRRR